MHATPTAAWPHRIAFSKILEHPPRQASTPTGYACVGSEYCPSPSSKRMPPNTKGVRIAFAPLSLPYIRLGRFLPGHDLPQPFLFLAGGFLFLIVFSSILRAVLSRRCSRVGRITRLRSPCSGRIRLGGAFHRSRSLCASDIRGIRSRGRSIGICWRLGTWPAPTRRCRYVFRRARRSAAASYR